MYISVRMFLMQIYSNIFTNPTPIQNGVQNGADNDDLKILKEPTSLVPLLVGHFHQQPKHYPWWPCFIFGYQCLLGLTSKLEKLGHCCQIWAKSLENVINTNWSLFHILKPLKDSYINLLEEVLAGTPFALTEHSTHKILHHGATQTVQCIFRDAAGTHQSE